MKVPSGWLMEMWIVEKILQCKCPVMENLGWYGGVLKIFACWIVSCISASMIVNLVPLKK